MSHVTGQDPELVTFASGIHPARTVLVLGAGASVSSGAPTAAELAVELSNSLVGGDIDSDDLAEAATLLEARVSRKALVEAVQARLHDLKPGGGLLALAEYPWHAIYTTNYDRLVERAYRRVGKDVVVVRSNYEFSALDTQPGTPLFKIHGCISQDVSTGHRGRLVLTELDYDIYAEYRELLFERLAMDLLSKDVLVIGQSLRDAHLRALIKRAVGLKDRRGAPGRVRALVYERDENRAQVQRQRGIEVALGSLESFIYAVAAESPPETSMDTDDAGRLLLKPALRIAAVDVDQALNRQSDVVRMFNGRAATFADIRAGVTFERSATSRLVTTLVERNQILTITGVAGVGKTTLARDIVSRLHASGMYAWEHSPAFQLDASAWLAVESQLIDSGSSGVLLIDDCAAELSQVNRLVERLAELDRRNLLLVLTAGIQQWRPRMKSRYIFERGSVEALSRLTDGEILNMVTLVHQQPAISELVDRSFALLTRPEQERVLRERARADMYVCLKNVFGADELDHILLSEFASLGSDQQEIYRLVSGLQAIGARVHRQLVLRYLDVRADEVLGLLSGLEGVVDEYDIAPDLGLYGWQTRHQVIAETIAKYKYSEQDSLYDLLDKLVEHLNPAVKVELRTLREVCNAEFGIRSLEDQRLQLNLFERLVELAPGERIPRHRLIGKLLDLGDLDRAAHELRSAEDAVGLDRPINRYKVRLQIERARLTRGLMEEDRLALLRKGEQTALAGLERFPDDKFSYSVYADVGIAIARLTGDTSTLDKALVRIDEAEDILLDPVLEENRRRYERLRRDFSA